MKSDKKPHASRPTGLHRTAQRLTPLIIVLVVGAGAAATLWLKNRPRASALSTTPLAATSPAQMTRDTLQVATPSPPIVKNDGTGIAPAEGPTNDAVHLLNAGNEMLDKGDIDGAIATYLRAMKMNPEDEEVYFNLAFAFAKQGKVNEAIRYYNEALRIFPDYAEAHNNLGNLLVSLKRYEEAAAHFSTAIKINPESSSTLNNFGKCLAASGRTSEAIVQFREAIRLNPNYLEAHFNLGAAWLLQGNNEMANREFEKALRIDPGIVSAIEAVKRTRGKPPAGPKAP
jgi:tetratricopeptide (TPR) repeat protein